MERGTIGDKHRDKFVTTPGPLFPLPLLVGLGVAVSSILLGCEDEEEEDEEDDDDEVVSLLEEEEE